MAYSSTPLSTSNTTTTATNTSLFLHRKTCRNREFRVWKRRRFKRLVSIRNELGPLLPSSSDFLSIFSSNWIPPAALGFVSAISLAKNWSKKKTRVSDYTSDDSNSKFNSLVLDIGEWILFTSPTPFNRFVMLRCPSISFEGGEFLEDVNEKLVKEEKHYVRLDSGRIKVKEERGNEEGIEYQRVCVGTKDGGVISLDWPANLDLSEERGLDTTVLLIPGTPDGSMDDNVRAFVCECLRRGLFPVVMNPRGCASSPLTTARLFTAADSDDICSAIQFIIRARPWSTLTGVGWGYGANMLTKYLAEAGEKTPLTAATCIDNPFDLDEATGTSPYSAAIDKKLTEGLIDILKSNKELFQGRRKGFDVEKALSAESIRDFDEAISSVSYGYDTLKEFYSNSSSRSLVGKLKIPVLFIQNNDGTVPLFSIPRGLIAENPFTNLLLCSCLPSNFTAISWYHQVAVEWLTAVELGLLKGRHPLLQDVDVTINLSKSLALVEGRGPATSDRLDSVLNLAELASSDASLDSMNEMFKKNGTAAYIQFDSNQVSPGLGSDSEALSENSSNNSIVANSPNDAAGNSSVESDRGQVLQTAQVVMNVLDATMPGTLKEEEKKKVLEAVGRGDTLIKALQDAVPEDVRGKLTSSVSEILQAQGKSVNFDGLLRVNQMGNVPSKIKEKLCGNSAVKLESNDDLSDDKGSASDMRDSNVNQANMIEHAGVETNQPQDESVKSSDLPGNNSVNIHDDDKKLTKGSIVSQNDVDDDLDNVTYSKQKLGEFCEPGDDGSDASSKLTSSSSSSNVSGGDSVETSMQNSRSMDDKVSQPDDKCSNMSARVGSDHDVSDQSKPGLADYRSSDSSGSDTPASSVSGGQPSEKGNDDSKSKDEKLVQTTPDQNNSSVTKNLTFSVSQALDALTGLDDSTQAAVNSVFGVIENMLTQLEEKQKDNPDKNEIENNDVMKRSVIEKTCIDHEIQLEKQKDGDEHEGVNPQNMESVNGYDHNIENSTTTVDRNKNNGKNGLVGDKLAARNVSQLLTHGPTKPYTNALYNEYLRKYILSKVQKVKPLELDTNTALFLNYNPEEGSWLLQEQPAADHDAVSNNSRNRVERASCVAKESVIDDIIEPSYVILDSEQQKELAEELKEKLNDKLVHHDSNLEKSILSAKTIMLDSLKVEVGRKLGATYMKDMEADLEAEMEEVANAVCLAIQHDNHNQRSLYSGSNGVIQNYNPLNGNHIIDAISQAVQNTSYLKRVLPVGVIVGSSLAALRNFLDLAAVHDNKNSSPSEIDQHNINGVKTEAKLLQEASEQPVEVNHYPIPEKGSREKGNDRPSTFSNEDDPKKVQSKTLNRDALMVSAVTAALGASAILSQQEVIMGSDSNGTFSSFSKEKHIGTETATNVDVIDDKQQSNIVTSLAEKAMSVAAPIVPTKEGGEVDQERIVAMLAELGQKGGVLKLVAKLALLWGGLRGAMSLTNRLISFLRLAERDLWQRVMGFSCMALVLWAPVLVPLLPTLLHNWATHNTSKIVELACILGLYTAVTILIMQWGKRIRGHEYPLKQYGVDFISSEKIPGFITGLLGGFLLVLSIQSVNALLGFTKLSWPSHLISSSLDLTTKLKAYGHLFLLAAQGILTASGIAFVEELLFRSWLLEEIAADLGYHPAILLSALVFALSQRSLHAIPGLWLLSLSLAGARLKNQGSLFIPIGMRTGIMASSFILQMGGFLTYQSKSRLWIGGTHLSQPFSGLVGLLFALLLAVVLYPRQHELRNKIPRTIRP